MYPGETRTTDRCYPAAWCPYCRHYDGSPCPGCGDHHGAIEVPHIACRRAAEGVA